jgi:glycosyltransferase involved in cell wall biosynthesis
VAFLFLLAGALVRGPLPPAVYTLHTSYPNLKLRNRLMLLPVFARFRRIVCCSQSSLESLPGSFRRLAGARLCAVRNGLDIARVDAALAGAAGARDPRGFCVVSVGRLMELKNPGVILRAFREVAGPGARLRLIGAGPLEATLRRESRELELEGQVELTGLVPREEVYRSLRDADLYVSASRCEGLPVSTLEAMACGIPVVLSDIPPHREIAEGCDFIPLVPLGDAPALARELAAFRALPAAARREIGARGRAWVERRFGLEAMERGYEAVYAGARAGSG